MRIRLIAMLFLLAAFTPAMLMSAPASTEAQKEAASLASFLSVINGGSPHAEGACGSSPLVTTPAVQQEPPLSFGLPFGAQPRTGGSCTCGPGPQGCCGCNPCPADGMGYCCSLPLSNGLCGAVQACGCLAC